MKSGEGVNAKKGIENVMNAIGEMTKEAVLIEIDEMIETETGDAIEQ